MENKVYYISPSEILEVTSTRKNCFIATIDGKLIQELPDFLMTMSDIFKFPYRSKSLDSYNDWMRDLEWLESDEYILVIRNYPDLLKADLASKNMVMDGLVNIILPWWQSDVEKYVVGGKKKSFNVYLVDM